MGRGGGVGVGESWCVCVSHLWHTSGVGLDNPRYPWVTLMGLNGMERDGVGLWQCLDGQAMEVGM